MSTRSHYIFRLVLNSKFSFPETGCHPRLESPGLSCYQLQAGRNARIHTFPKGIYVKTNATLEIRLGTPITLSFQICSLLYGCAARNENTEIRVRFHSSLLVGKVSIDLFSSQHSFEFKPEIVPYLAQDTPVPLRLKYMWWPYDLQGLWDACSFLYSALPY